MATRSDKLVFANGRGQDLAGRLELPPDEVGAPHAFALFAHCFTCSKDVPAASRISRSLAGRGLAVLRFDFTGLGGSDGEFANESFSSNVADLVAAADHLREHHQAPRLLIGHSLGGAAVITAANRIPEVRAVATIAAPSDPDHVRHLLRAGEDEVRARGEATVDIGGRPFRIAASFLDDLSEQSLEEELADLRRALLVFHSPADRVVDISHARRIYEAARGYRSFVTLPDADHLLTDKRDTEYVADVLAAWATRYLA